MSRIYHVQTKGKRINQSTETIHEKHFFRFLIQYFWMDLFDIPILFLLVCTQSHSHNHLNLKRKKLRNKTLLAQFFGSTAASMRKWKHWFVFYFDGFVFVLTAFSTITLSYCFFFHLISIARELYWCLIIRQIVKVWCVSLNGLPEGFYQMALMPVNVLAVAATQSADHIHITNREKAATDSTNSIKRWMATPNNSLNGNLNFIEKLD